MSDALLKMLQETVVRVNDPAKGESCATSQEMNLEVNASSLVTRVSLEENRVGNEDILVASRQ